MSVAQGLSTADHRRVSDYVGRVAGILLPEYKRKLVEARLRKRMRATGHGNFSDYLDFALSSAGASVEQILLIDALTTNKTDFFREPAHFQFLERYLQRRLERGPLGRPLRIWSAACSSGEEAYSLAILMSELALKFQRFEFRIEATDIAPSMLDATRRGIYSEDRIAPVPLELRKRYFLRSRDRAKQLIRMGPALRSHLSVRPLNLISDDYGPDGHYDVIFCRNVMIYFNQANRAAIVRQMNRALAPGGLLFVGHSESIRSYQSGLISEEPAVYRKPD
ncbi:CheR family methyltransferase [Marinobacter sp. M-5]|uniref:CheR family methyltransferase n=1 Tax=Marinobacter sp. M-5 TaxID=3081089 RepID=UPI00293D14D4|nr:CheR family methyltransferase [Marinobacter sp. M-5]MDV3504201.1 CheR family methyltransferase [Marinobacter sp. M-5]